MRAFLVVVILVFVCLCVMFEVVLVSVGVVDAELVVVGSDVSDWPVVAAVW